MEAPVDLDGVKKVGPIGKRDVAIDRRRIRNANRPSRQRNGIPTAPPLFVAAGSTTVTTPFAMLLAGVRSASVAVIATE